MIRRELVDTSYGQIHLRRKKGEGTPLVLLHMSPLSSRMWLPLMRRLDRPMIAPDRLGFGFSDPPSVDLDMKEYAMSTLETLDALGVGGFDLLGEHTGSVEAVALAHLAPERVGTVGLVAIPAYTDEEVAERQSTRASPPPEPDEAGSHLMGLWQRRLAYRSAPFDLEHLHDLTVQELVSAGPYKAYRAVFAYPMAERLSELKQRIVVFAPDDDLSLQTQRARSLLPEGAVWIDLPDLGLDIWEVAPDRLTALVEQHMGEPQ